MKLQEIFDIINSLEEQFPVDKWVIDGIHVWPLIRYQITWQLQEITRDSQEHTFEKIINAFDRNSSFINAYYCDYKHNAKLREKVDAIFLTHSHSRSRLNGTWFDTSFDPYLLYLDEIGKKSLVLECTIGNDYRVPRYNSSIFIQSKTERIYYTDRVKASLFRFNQQIALPMFEEFVGYLKEIINVPAFLDIKTLELSVKVIRDTADYFKKIFRKSKPVLAFSECYCTNTSYAFNLACREEGIISIEVQDGTQGDFSISHSRFSRVPKEGYEIFPKLYWYWNESEATVISNWNHPCKDAHDVLVAGNMWLDMWRDNSMLCKRYDDIILDFKESIQQKSNIILTLQWGIDNLGMKDWIIDAIRKTEDSCFWWIRLHPKSVDMRTQIKKLLLENELENFELDKSTDMPFPALLRHMDVHVTNFSSSVLEAEYLSVPSILTDPYANEVYRPQIASGTAILVDSSTQLIEAIEIQLLKKEKMLSSVTQSINNPKIVLKNLLKQGERNVFS